MSNGIKRILILTVKYPLLSFTQPITTSLPTIMPFPEEKPKPTHPVVAASTANDTVSLSQSTVQYSFINSCGSNTAWWAYSEDKSVALARIKAENTTSSDANMFLAVARVAPLTKHLAIYCTSIWNRDCVTFYWLSCFISLSLLELLVITCQLLVKKCTTKNVIFCPFSYLIHFETFSACMGLNDIVKVLENWMERFGRPVYHPIKEFELISFRVIVDLLMMCKMELVTLFLAILSLQTK